MSNQLIEIVKTSGLEKTKADYILQKFQDYFRIASEWESKAHMLNVTSETQVAEMKMAREGRLYVKQVLVSLEKDRKETKEQSLLEGKAIDGISNIIKALLMPIKDHFEKQEKFLEIQEDNKKEVIRAERTQELQKLGADATLYDLKNMPEESYIALIAGIKITIQQKIEAEKKAEEERIEREKEQERVRLENERLKKEAIEKERQLKEARAKADEERRLAEEKERKLKAEQEARLKEEREEREKVEAQLKAKADEEKKERKRIEQEKKKAERAPDKEKLNSIIEKLKNFELPEVKSQEAKRIVIDVRSLLDKTAKYIAEKTNEI